MAPTQSGRQRASIPAILVVCAHARGGPVPGQYIFRLRAPDVPTGRGNPGHRKDHLSGAEPVDPILRAASHRRCCQCAGFAERRHGHRPIPIQRERDEHRSAGHVEGRERARGGSPSCPGERCSEMSASYSRPEVGRPGRRTAATGTTPTLPSRSPYGLDVRHARSLPAAIRLRSIAYLTAPDIDKAGNTLRHASSNLDKTAGINHQSIPWWNSDGCHTTPVTVHSLSHMDRASAACPRPGRRGHGANHIVSGTALEPAGMRRRAARPST